MSFYDKSSSFRSKVVHFPLVQKDVNKEVHLILVNKYTYSDGMNRVSYGFEPVVRSAPQMSGRKPRREEQVGWW